MKKNSAGECGVFNPRVLLSFALCSVGLLLAMFSFAATPQIQSNSIINITAVPEVFTRLGSSPDLPSPVSSGPVLLRPSASIADLQNVVSPHASTQTSGGTADSWRLVSRTEQILLDSPHLAY